MSSQRHVAYAYRARAPRPSSLFAPFLAFVALLLGLSVAMPSAAQELPAPLAGDPAHAGHTANQHAAALQAEQAAAQEPQPTAAQEPQPSDDHQHHDAVGDSPVYVPDVQSPIEPTGPGTPLPPETPPDAPTAAPQAPDAPQPTAFTHGAMEPVTWNWIPNCAANTVPFEAQAWWMNDFGHAHVGFCAPKNLTIRGKYTFDTHLVMFHNPGKLTLLQAQIDGASTSVGGQTSKVDLTCPITQTCVFDRSVSIDASEFPNSGWHHVRIRATVKEPDGKELVATNFIPVYLDNGKPRKDKSGGMVINGTTNYVAGRGWYTNAGYVWSVFFDPPTAGKRVSGVHTFKVRPMASENKKPISYFVVKVDSTHTDPGKIMYESRNGKTDVIDVAVDTRKLSNGWHSIIARTEAAGYSGASCSQFCSGQKQTHAGDGKIWFYVDNGGGNGQPPVVPSPTKQPTAVPTSSPTKQPTAGPTKQPTAGPTKQPTAVPTAKAPTPTQPPMPTSQPGQGVYPPGVAQPVTWNWIPNCASNTVPFEAQAWWMNDFGHVHVGFCAPKNLTIRGKYTFDTHLVMFHNPGKLTLLQAQIDSSKTSVGGQTSKVDLTCPITQTCVFDRSVSIDASKYPNSGWHHVRIRAVVKEPDGKEMVATNFIPVFLDNGKPRKDYTSGMVINGTTNYVAGRGWYTDAGYTWSVFFDPPTANKRVSGVYTLKVRPMATKNRKPISYFVVKLDSTHTDPGKVLYEHRSTSTDIIDVSIDTRQLPNGWHSVIARTEAAGYTGASCSQFCSGQKQTHAGDGKIWFYVDN